MKIEIFSVLVQFSNLGSTIDKAHISYRYML